MYNAIPSTSHLSPSYPSVLQSLPARDEALRNTLLFITSVISPWTEKKDIKNFIPNNEEQWDHIFYYADRWLVAPLLYNRLEQKDLHTVCPKDFLQALNAYYLANIKRNDNHRRVLLETVKILNDVGIKPILLKGAHALVELLPDHRTRIISDIDLLILDGKELVALDALKKQGYIQEHKGSIKNNPQSHHLDPLFHPSSAAYLELHRRPNYSEYYPNILEHCFDPKHLREVNIDNLIFYALHPWQILLYNQIHHYHSSINKPAFTYLDMRHIVEQASIIYSMTSTNEDDFIMQTRKTLKNKKNIVEIQIKLLEHLFSKPIFRKDIDPRSIEKSFYIIKRLLENPLTFKELLFQYLKYFNFLACSMLNYRWLNNRILNIDWYFSRPRSFKSHINNLKLIRKNNKYQKSTCNHITSTQLSRID